MTDADIIKALECCVTIDGCKKCPRGKNGKICKDYNEFIRAILDLINRQKAEITRLEDILRCQADGIIELNCQVAQAKSSAVKEFAEKLKKKSQLVAPSVYAVPFRAVAIDDINNFVKERVGDDS